MSRTVRARQEGNAFVLYGGRGTEWLASDLVVDLEGVR